MAATPMAMPRADKAARSLRVRTPTAASRARSAARSRAGTGAMVVMLIPPARSGALCRPGGGVGDDAAVEHLDLAAHPGGDGLIVGDHHDGGPPAFSSPRSSSRDAPVALSRLPVGSSASTIAGSPASARAIATRWRSPPDSCVGRDLSLCPSPTRRSAQAARSRRSPRAAPP